MPELHSRVARIFLVAIAVMALSACSSLEGAGGTVSKAVTPYKMDVIQGNVVTREQAAVLKVGMQRAQVRDVLGSALLASVFHADRWDYVFTLKRQGAEAQTRKLTVFFKGDVLERIESDELPSESEFVATLKSNPKSGTLPAMEASEAALLKSPAASKNTAPAVVLPAAPASYPPLEPAGK